MMVLGRYALGVPPFYVVFAEPPPPVLHGFYFDTWVDKAYNIEEYSA